MGTLTKLDTHYYDGMLKDVFAQVSKAFHMWDGRDPKEKFLTYIWAVRRLIPYVPNSSKYPRAREAVDLLEFDRKANFDSTDNIDSELLFVYIFENLPVDDMGFFLEQLEDIVVSGPCPQGRAKRLLQVVNSLL